MKGYCGDRRNLEERKVWIRVLVVVDNLELTQMYIILSARQSRLNGECTWLCVDLGNCPLEP